MSPSPTCTDDATLALLTDAADRYNNALSAVSSQDFAQRLDDDLACAYLWERLLDVFLDAFPLTSGDSDHPAANRETAQEALVDWYKRWTTENAP